MLNFAKNGLNKYYPSEKAYFEPMFSQIDKSPVLLQTIINNNLDKIINQQCSNEQDKVATMLIGIEIMMGGKQFMAKATTAEDQKIAMANNFIQGIQTDAATLKKTK